MRTLYPELSANNSFQLPVSNEHTLYVEESGNPDGIPVIFLHGGPGSGCNENHRRYFNPDKYRIVIFDQRGCNRSTPQGCVENNTTQDILNDIEQIRNRLKIDQWLVFGGSWGATLALLYAEAFPEKVLGLVIRGAFLARQRDLDWFIKEGANRIFPEYWQAFIQHIPESERHDIAVAFHQRVHCGDEKIREKYARLWSQWAGKVVMWNLGITNGTNGEEGPQKIVNEVTIETHYAINHYFINDNQILENTGSLPSVPVSIIHGRRDLTCTLESSWLLHQAISESEFIVVPDAGHLAGEPPMTDALVTATDKMSDRF